jgi:hypothetical protein
MKRLAARDAKNSGGVSVATTSVVEREKMDIHFAQGKLELGRFVCKKPVN